jgi:hypothetical protein
MTAAESIFRQVFRSIGGGKRIAVLINAYFDESAEQDSQNGMLSVSGYDIELAGLDGLIHEWRRMINDYS